MKARSSGVNNKMFQDEISKQVVALTVDDDELQSEILADMDKDDFDDLKQDLKDAQKDLNKIRNGEYSDVKLEVNYQYANASNEFESVQMTEDLDKAINQVIKHLTNIGCSVRNDGMSDKFWGLKITFPIKLSQSDNLDMTLDGLPEGIIKDFNQFIMDYKIDDGGIIERLVKSGGLAAFGKPGTKAAKAAKGFGHLTTRFR